MRRKKIEHPDRLRDDGKTRAWPMPREFGPRGGDLNMHMCSEDISLDIWAELNACRSQSHSQGARPTIRLDDCSQELADCLVGAIPDSHDYQKLSDALPGFLQMIAREIVISGSVTYEVRRGWDDSITPPKMVVARMRHVPPNSLKTVNGALCQVVPPGTFAELPDGGTVNVDDSALVRFVAPNRWAPVLDQMRDDLMRIGRSQQAWMDRMSAGLGSDDGRPFSEGEREYAIAVAKATSAIGWTGRSQFDKFFNDYYFAQRKLNWKRFCLELRDHLLRTIAGAFLYIGAACGERPVLVADGLRTTSDLDQADDDLRTGKTPIITLLKRIERS